MAKFSTGFRDHLLATGSVKGALDGGVIRIYSGTAPATADAALSGNVLLNTISLDATGAGINMGTTPVSGVLGKASAEVWRGLNVASGVASFYRFSSLTDDGSSSTSEKRLQGTVGVAGADLNFSDINFVSAEYKTIDSFNVAVPTA